MSVALWAAAALLISQTAEPIPDLAEQLYSGALDPVFYDYGALRFDAVNEVEGWETLNALERAVSQLATPGGARDGQILEMTASGCRVAAVYGGTRLVKRVPDRSAYDAARSDALANYRIAQAGLAERLEGVSEPLDAAVIRDQFWRSRIVAPRDGEQDDFASQFELEVLMRGLCFSDAENAAFLTALFEDKDQFFETIYGPDRWDLHVLIQHAPLSLQREVLDEMTMSEGFGALPHQLRAQAFLVDRVNVLEGRPQEFGTQGRCVYRRWTYMGEVDLEAAAERRAAWGLEPLEAALARHNAGCQTLLGAGP
jgi:hypothetical protein